MATLPDSAPHLRRGVGLRTSTATSTGLAFAALNYLGAVTVAIFVAGDAAWLAILIAGLLALVAAFAFGELNGLYPTAAAIRLYMKHSMDDRVAVGAALEAMIYAVAAYCVIVLRRRQPA